jgi:hypothetical protein
LKDHEEHNLEACQGLEEDLERFGGEMRERGVGEEKREGGEMFSQHLKRERERIRENKIFSIQKHLNILFHEITIMPLPQACLKRL